MSLDGEISSAYGALHNKHKLFRARCCIATCSINSLCWVNSCPQLQSFVVLWFMWWSIEPLIIRDRNQEQEYSQMKETKSTQSSFHGSTTFYKYTISSKNKTYIKNGKIKQNKTAYEFHGNTLTLGLSVWKLNSLTWHKTTNQSILMADSAELLLSRQF